MTADRPGATDALIEAATTAFRERDAATGRILPSPAWWDLSATEREQLFAWQLANHALESGLDAEGLTSTARAVLDRLPGVAQVTGE
jgi:hypothetical protein